MDQQINAVTASGPPGAADESGLAPVCLRLQGVRKEFPAEAGGQSVVAVDTTDMVVHRGEFVTIVGPSGCGKSTLLNILAGLEAPSAGHVFVDGREPADRRPYFGYMFQKDLLFPWRTIRDNVAVGLEIQGRPRRDARRQATGILERFGLAGFADKYPAQLSGGMRQRAALMRTLLCERDFLLLDEPFGALDALTRSIMQEWLLSIWEADHRTIVFITHDIEEAVFLSDRVLMMSAHPGRIKGEQTIDIPRPRGRAVVTSRRFAELKKVLLDNIYEESLKAEPGMG